jgi:hypothetical protein
VSPTIKADASSIRRVIAECARALPTIKADASSIRRVIAEYAGALPTIEAIAYFSARPLIVLVFTVL